ncbi:hypothetical protein CC78DRAFT_587490 [Lojkania enalia]|uniref:DNA2/NAM7 helicase-like C-terminal domain-containing protein n=1 Tax=Lojkania enalia TaxID=147567 RepID=A0A9P4K0W1_9PLEO|nr:hypothetical protein CC78DRAFT_587490 [Didymosphaeria enalia]
MLTTLLPSIEHAVLIGDHLQLRVSSNTNEFQYEHPQGRQYALDMLFERLVQPLLEILSITLLYSSLEIQRRRDPSISNFIWQTLYPAIKDDSRVMSYPEVVDLRKCPFWFDHKYTEVGADINDFIATSKSKDFRVDGYSLFRPAFQDKNKLSQSLEVALNDRDRNDLEAAGIIEERSCTLQQAKGIAKTSLLRTVGIATVDNFQGEESKIVIISLVRCNDINITHAPCLVASLATRNARLLSEISISFSSADISSKTNSAGKTRILILYSAQPRLHERSANANTLSMFNVMRMLTRNISNAEQQARRPYFVVTNLSILEKLDLCARGYARFPLHILDVANNVPRFAPLAPMLTVHLLARIVDVHCYVQLLVTGYLAVSVVQSYSPAAINVLAIIKDMPVDFIELKKYGEIDAHRDPCVFLPCRRFLAMTNMDGRADFAIAYELNPDVSVKSIKASPPFSTSLQDLPTCPTCRGSLRSINRYGRIVRRILIDESTKRVVILVGTMYGSLVGRVHDEQEALLVTTTTADLPPFTEPLTFCGNRDQEFSNILK